MKIGICTHCGKQGAIHEHHIIPRMIWASTRNTHTVKLCPSCHKIQEIRIKTLFDYLTDWRANQNAKWILFKNPEKLHNLSEEELDEMYEILGSAMQTYHKKSEVAIKRFLKARRSK